MLDQLMGVVLLGLGLQPGVVLGEEAKSGRNLRVERRNRSETASESGNMREGDREERQPQVDLRATRDAERSRLDADKKHFEQEMQTRQAEAREKFASRQAELKDKLEESKDEHRKEVLTRLNEMLQRVNARRTTQMKERLQKMRDILDKISQRSTSVQTQGGDISEVLKQIALAKSAITAAEAAVATQAGMTYSVSATADKGEAGRVRSQLNKDIKAVNEKVMVARKAVGEAIQALAHAHESVPRPTGGGNL